MQRSERLIRLTKRLVERPLHPVSLAQLADEWGVAKSSLSEDIGFIRGVLETSESGKVESLIGAQGGIRFRLHTSQSESSIFLAEIASVLSEAKRVLPGDFVYMSDVIGDPDVLDKVGRLISWRYREQAVNVVVTVETKGISIATATARYLNVPIAIVRREQRVTEGAAISTHYVTGSTRRIQTMSLGKRAMPSAARALIVDDFMRAGATAQGVQDLLQEFEAEVVGTAVFMATSQPQHKMVDNYFALLYVDKVTRDGAVIRPVQHVDEL